MNTTLQQWTELHQDFEAAAQEIITRTEDSAELSEEGIRFLYRLFEGMKIMCLDQDAANPWFTPLMTRSRKYFADNPDTDYFRALLDSHYNYRIKGNRGSCEYLSFCVYTTTSEGVQIVSQLSDKALNINKDGDFDVILSANTQVIQNRPSMELAKGINTVVCRQYFLDRETEENAAIDIEILDTNTETSITTPALSRFEKLRFMFNHGWKSTVAATDDWVKTPNEIGFSSDASLLSNLFPTPDNHYIGGWFELESNQYLELSFTPPTCRYWSIQLLSRWLESYDDPEGNQIINKKKAILKDDGSVTIRIATETIQADNLLHTNGRHRGFFLFRWMQTPEYPTDISCSVCSY